MLKFVQRKNQWCKPETENFSILFAGDICPRKEGLELVKAGRNEEIFKDVKPFFDSADCRVIQWETTLTDSETPIDKCGPNLKVPPCCVSAAGYLNIDVALLANNHIGDFGPEAAMETISHLQHAGIKTVGAGADLDDAEKPLALNFGSIPVTLFNIAENEFGGARKDRPGTNMFRLLRNLQSVREAKAKGGLVFVALHGGHETNPFPSPRMADLFRGFLDAGADLVWNCHTHCPEAVELWNGKPIVYSPGNFFFPAMGDPADPLPTWWGGYLVKFTFDAKGVCGMELLPYQQSQTAVKPLSPEREEKFFRYLETLCAPMEDSEALQHKFDLWCAGSGEACVKRILSQQDSPELEWRKRETVKEFMALRNFNTCEAHHDMVSRTLRLIEQYELAGLKAGREEILNLQKPDWIEKLY